MAETAKARTRREMEAFFFRYVKGRVIDIGFGDDPLTPDCDRWDMKDGDATLMSTVADATYDTVYASHILEHLSYPILALRNWWRILKPGGHLIVFVPHRDLYEKQNALPSRWNADHKSYWLPIMAYGSSYWVHSLLDDCMQAVGEDYGTLRYLKVCDDYHTITDPNRHSDGEYSIEIVLRKPL